MHINNEQSNQRLPASFSEEDTTFIKTPLRRKVRRPSLHASDRRQTEPSMARVRHTLNYSSRGCKGNARGDFIHDSFITFEELLTTLPKDIGLDIEIS